MSTVLPTSKIDNKQHVIMEFTQVTNNITNDKSNEDTNSIKNDQSTVVCTTNDISIEDINIIDNFEVNIVDHVKATQIQTIKYKDLYNYLSSYYNRENRLGRTGHEHFNALKTLVKPHFDIDLTCPYCDPMKTEQTKDKFIEIASQLLNVSKEEWAISDDCRLHHKKEKDANTNKTKSIQCYKISFHFVLWSKKCKLRDLKYWVKIHEQDFINSGVEGIDLQIYRNGINKFRLPMTKKSQDELGSLLTPRNYGDINNFHKHIVQIIDYCDELKIDTAPSDNYETKQERIERQIQESQQNATDEIESIIKSYFIISAKYGENEYAGCIFYDIPGTECGLIHSHNHNYLIHNTINNTLKLKCHSQKCTDFQRILYKEKAATTHFDIDYFLNIPINDDQDDNYVQVRKYFEEFFIFIRDSNSYYRKRKEYNQKYQYYERELKPINIQGFSDLTYKIKKKKDNEDNNDEIQHKNFLSRYKMDAHRESYLGLCFQPYGINSPLNKVKNGDYNLFDGFNYNTVLSYAEKSNITVQTRKDFEFFMNYIKDHICGLYRANNNIEQISIAEHSFDYLMYFLANIIQNPTIVPHIIMIFFSKTHGTGKSGFLKFISQVIGPNLTYFGSYDQIMEKHTNAHVGKLINVIEEIDCYSSKKYHNQIKDLSQRERAVYNEKNKPQYIIKTFVRYFKTTNYQDGVWFDTEDRRYVLYTFDKIEDENYIKKLLNIMEDPYIIYLFGKYLAEEVVIPYNRLVDWEKHRPLTSDYYNMQSEDPITQFLKDLLKLDGICLEHLHHNEYFMAQTIDNKVYDENVIVIAKETFYQLYIKFYDEYNCMNRSYKNKHKFLSHLSINFKQEITIRKFWIKSGKDYYVIYLHKLWQKLFPKFNFVNYHLQYHENKDQSIINNTQQ